jgi:hypothetical protein
MKGGVCIMKNRFLSPTIAAALILSACGEITGWRNSDVGTLSFDYSGAESGTFSVRGARPHDWTARPHAAGQRLESPEYTHVSARGHGHQFFLAGYSIEAGTYPMADDHGAGTFYGELAMDVASSENSARAIYVFISGSITLEAERAGRIRGRFGGTARRLDGVSLLHIEDGRFDVPNNLLPPVD